MELRGCRMREGLFNQTLERVQCLEYIKDFTKSLLLAHVLFQPASKNVVSSESQSLSTECNYYIFPSQLLSERL